MLFVALPVQAPPGFQPIDERELNGGKLPERHWWVSMAGERVRIESWAAYRQRVAAEARKNPPKPKVKWKEEEGLNLFWSPGMGVRVDDGWLMAYDAGEWGGALYWFSPTGDRRVRISDSNTKIVVRTKRGQFAVESLAHMMFWYARLVAVERKGGAWSKRLVTDLHVTPREVVQDGERLVYITDEFVSVLETDGRQREVFRTKWEALYSLARAPGGVLWIGAERAVLRLTPKGDRYTAQWFAPVKASTPARGRG